MLHRLIIVLAAFALITLSAAASAQAPQPRTPISVAPVSVGPATRTGAGLTYPITYSASGGTSAANARWYGRLVPMSPTSIGGAARSLLRGGLANAALIAALAAIGWGIDEIMNDLYGEGSGGIAAQPGVGYMVNNNAAYFSPTIDGSIALFRAATPSVGSIRSAQNSPPVQYQDGRPILYNYEYNYAAGYASHQFYDGAFSVVVVGSAAPHPPGYQPGQELEAAPQPVPDAELGAAIVNNPALWPHALTMPDGAPLRVQPVLDPIPGIRQEHEQFLGLDPDPNQAPDPVQADDPTSESGMEPTPWPAFCKWATVVCDLVKFLKEKPADPPDDELPETPLEAEDWTSGLASSASCPAPRTIAMSMGSFSMSWQPVCDLALGIRALLLISASLVAAYILSGASSRA